MNLARLKAARERKGLTQVGLAKQLDVSSTVPGQWERGERSPTTENLLQLAAALDVSASWILGEKVEGDTAPYAGRIKGPESILADYDTAPGLRELASQKKVHAALDIRPEEWAALRSLESPYLLTTEGYLSVLLAIRASVAKSGSVTKS